MLSRPLTQALPRLVCCVRNSRIASAAPAARFSGRPTTVAAVRPAASATLAAVADTAAAMGNMKVPGVGGAHQQFSVALQAIDTSQYKGQLQDKAAAVRAKFARFSPPELEVFRSAPEHYRMR